MPNSERYERGVTLDSHSVESAKLKPCSSNSAGWQLVGDLLTPLPVAEGRE
jgi:hypothetical protein